MLRNLQERKFLCLKCIFQLSFNMMASNVFTVLVMLPFSQFLMLGIRGSISFEWQVWACVLSFPFDYL